MRTVSEVERKIEELRTKMLSLKKNDVIGLREASAWISALEWVKGGNKTATTFEQEIKDIKLAIITIMDSIRDDVPYWVADENAKRVFRRFRKELGRK